MKLLGFDVESSGTLPEYALQPARVRTGDAWLTSYAWSSTRREQGAAVAYPSKKHLAEFLERVADKGVTLCGWNIPFDVAWLLALGLREQVFRINWLDGMCLLKHLTNQPSFIVPPISHGLKPQVAKRWPEHAGYGKDIDFLSTEPAMVRQRLIYNQDDSYFSVNLCAEYLAQMTPLQRRGAMIEAACIPMVAESIVEGLVVNEAHATALGERLGAEAADAFLALQISDPANVSEAALSSPKQLANLLFNIWGLPVQKLTDGGEPSTDKEALDNLAAIDPRASMAREYREAKNNKTKFATGIAESAAYNGDGRVRPKAKIFGTYSGRLTYSSKDGKGKAERPVGIPIHQMKRDPEFRRTIEAPEGYDLIEFDFAGQEYRWMAVLSGDETMLGLCAPGEDPHSFMGSRLAHRDYREIAAAVKAGEKEAKKSRQAGKVANLSCQYRTSAKTLWIRSRVDHKMDISLSEAAMIHRTYQATYPGVPAYWRRQVRHIRANREVSTLAGRTVRIPDGHEIKWSAESTAINFPIQGIGADQKYLGLAVMKNFLPTFDGRFYFELHDGLFFVVPKAKSAFAVEMGKKVLSNLPYKKAWDFQPPVAFPVDAKVGPSWGQLKEV
jgi:DNA polymerase I-like protein with 3'-5' exonuclease and polymerase domains